MDPPHRTPGSTLNRFKHFGRVLKWALTAMLWAGLFFSAACSLPRIIVLEDPLTPEEHLQLGLAYENDGAQAAAEREYRAAAGKLPLAHLYLGNLYFTQRDWTAAESHYRRAIRALPDNPEPYNNLAWLYYVRGENLDEAESLARRAVELAPPDRKTPFQDTLAHVLRAREGANRPNGSPGIPGGTP